MSLKRARSPNNTPEKSSGKSAKVDVHSYVLNVVKAWLKNVFLVTGAHNGNIGHLLTLVKMPLSHFLGIMKILHFLQPLFGRSIKGLIIVSDLFQTRW